MHKFLVKVKSCVRFSEATIMSKGVEEYEGGCACAAVIVYVS